MHTDKVEDFLRKVRMYKVNHTEANSDDFASIKLPNLYDKENEGELTLETDFIFSGKDLLLIEGHYTSRSEISMYIDINLCLLCNPDELL